MDFTKQTNRGGAALLCALVSSFSSAGCAIAEGQDPARAALFPEPDQKPPAGEPTPQCTEEAEAPACEPGGDRYYAHPLQNLQRLADGRLPFIDAPRSPSGNAYVIAEGFGASDASDPEPKTLYSGVIEARVRQMTEAERARLEPRPQGTPARKTDAALTRVLEEAEARTHLPSAAEGSLAQPDAVTGGATEQEPSYGVQIHLQRALDGTTTQRINRAIAEGRVQTYADRRRVRDEALAELAEAVKSRVTEVEEQVIAEGGEVTFACQYAACVSARLTPRAISRIAEMDVVRRMGIHEETTLDELNGREKADVYQTRLFWDQTFSEGGTTYDFSGANGAATDIFVAVLDSQGFRTSHRAFLTGTSGSRLFGMRDCREPPCVSVTSFDVTGEHGTRVLGTLLGDYRDGQDVLITTAVDREIRSASAGEARAYLYQASRQTGDQQAVYDSVVSLSPAPHLLVSSNSIGNPTDCSGEDAAAIGADGVYEAGIAYFKSMNQNDGGSASDCTAGRPSEAIGIFAVAGFDDDAGTEGNTCQSKTARIHPAVNWGGATTNVAEGKGRSIVALTGSFHGSDVADSLSNTATADFDGTSHASPSVAAAAVNLIDMFKNLGAGTNFIDDPGVLYTWMLNMGDRRSQTGSLMTSRYDHRTGAGNIRMRFLGAAGMELPWEAHHLELCVGEGEVITIPLSSGLPVAADSIRATAWWYDRRIEDGTTIDNIDLQLRVGTSVRESNDSLDNKERVYFTGINNRPVSLDVFGANVTSDVEGCGANRMRVFVTIIAEDDDRNTPADGGPNLDATTCIGVDRL